MRLFLYKLKCMISDPGRIFWVAVFPILLGSLFSFTFGTLLNEDVGGKPVKTAAVEKSDNYHFKAMLDYLSGEDQNLLDVRYTDEDTALNLLEDGEISGVFYIDETPGLTVSGEGAEPTVLAAVLNSYIGAEAAAKDIVSDVSEMTPQIASSLSENKSYVQSVDLNATVNSLWRENFYALIAMTCLYGGFFGLTSAAELKAGESPTGERLAVSPVPKSRLILADCIAMTVLEFAITVVLLLYLNYVLKVDLGSNLPYMLLSCLCGSFCGVMLGMLAGVALNISASAKEALLVGISLGVCFLSGLMYPSMRLLVERNAPFFNRINPAALISDSLYSLDAYGARERYFTDIASLVIIGVIFTTISVLILRRSRNGGN